ncbi:MAG: hypothetical protein KJ647_02130 [Candidatus Omnitrophica bacterium]|nr:hypothetical protein [Candidatus Omnitrophota bacterium]MCG2708458.1 hypothetical protein [Candidatus Omnitrophota bacterium]
MISKQASKQASKQVSSLNKNFLAVSQVDRSKPEFLESLEIRAFLLSTATPRP